MTSPDGNAGSYGPVSASVTLDASGNGMVSFAATGVKLQINYTRVSVTTNTKEAIATIYKGQVGAAYQIEGSMAGSSGDTSDTVFYLNDGERIYIVWTGGDVGAVATAVVTGWQSVPGRGFRAIH
jgi:hypothetical protein